MHMNILWHVKSIKQISADESEGSLGIIWLSSGQLLCPSASIYELRWLSLCCSLSLCLSALSERACEEPLTFEKIQSIIKHLPWGSLCLFVSPSLPVPFLFWLSLSVSHYLIASSSAVTFNTFISFLFLYFLLMFETLFSWSVFFSLMQI